MSTGRGQCRGFDEQWRWQCKPKKQGWVWSWHSSTSSTKSFNNVTAVISQCTMESNMVLVTFHILLMCLWHIRRGIINPRSCKCHENKAPATGRENPSSGILQARELHSETNPPSFELPDEMWIKQLSKEMKFWSREKTFGKSMKSGFL